MKSLYLLIFLPLFSINIQAQTFVIGTQIASTNVPSTDLKGFGFSTRMGVELLNLELGIKTFFGRVSREDQFNYYEQEAYGVSLYSHIPAFRINRFQFIGTVESGASLGYNNFGGTDRLAQMGVGGMIQYRIHDYFNLEVGTHYLVTAALRPDEAQFTHLLNPYIGWSVRI